MYKLVEHQTWDVDCQWWAEKTNCFLAGQRSFDVRRVHVQCRSFNLHLYWCYRASYWYKFFTFLYTVFIFPLLMSFQENLAPFLLVSSKNIFEADGFVVNCEQVEVCSCKTFMEGLALLVESFWVFDMQYPKATKDIYNFMECCLFKLKAVKPSRCVYSVLTKLSFPDSTW